MNPLKDPPSIRIERNKIFLLAWVSISNSEQKINERGETVPVKSKKQYENLINKQLKSLGLQDDAYDSAVKSLADILVQRDKTFEEFQDSGGKSVIEYTNKGGSTNMTKNPLLVLWDDLNKTALAYWRELGMTPSSYKKLTGEGPKKEEKQKGLAAALASIES